MLTILSPAKTLDESCLLTQHEYTNPLYVQHATRLIRKLNALSKKKIKLLMGLSDKLASLNKQRYADFTTPFTPENAKQSVLMFKGDVYQGLAVEDFDKEDFTFAQQNLRILSGLYGVLKPLDLIQPHRLEMGTRLPVGRNRNLYEFWAKLVTDHLNQVMVGQNTGILVNLASNEYFKVVDTKNLQGRVISPVFKEERNSVFTMVSFFAKKARGMLARYIIKNRLNRVDDISNFDLEGYHYNENLSAEDTPVFTRKS